MTRKQIAIVALMVVVASALSALVAYRRALRRAGFSSAPFASAQSEAEGCVDFTEAGDHTGETRCVSGRVLRVFASRNGNTFLDFCQDYRRCPFTSVIFSSDREKFGNLETLGGRQVEIRGPIVPYNGHAEIVIREPEQIHVAN